MATNLPWDLTTANGKVVSQVANNDLTGPEVTTLEMIDNRPLKTVLDELKEELLLVKAENEQIKQALEGTLKTEVTGSNLQEQLIESDATDGVLTFADDIHEVEIYNRDTVDGTFTVNGIGIIVPANEAFQAKIGGTPSTDVTITDSSSYVVGRYA